MLIEFFEDVFEEDPYAALVSAKDEFGEVVFEDTGDPLIDKWEHELSQGLDPDLDEGLNPEDKKKLRKTKELVNKHKDVLDKLDNIDEDFTKVPKEYQSKRVIAGSKEESDLLKGKLLGIK